MSYQNIHAKMKAHGFVTLAAEVLEKSPSSVSQVINGDCISLPIAKGIAKILKCHVWEAFPKTPQYQPNYSLKKVNAKKRALEVETMRQQLAS